MSASTAEGGHRLPHADPPEPTAAAPGPAAELVSFALEALPSVRSPSGLYCFDRTEGDQETRGQSVRYTLMVLIGLQRAARAGHEVPEDLDALLACCLTERASFTVGDLGLALWADAGGEGGFGNDLVVEIAEHASRPDSLDRLPGMEIAWLLIGLADACAGTPSAEAPLASLLEYARGRRLAGSGLYYQDSGSRLRRHLPNFATQIYMLLALGRVARTGQDPRAIDSARALAGQLLRLQRDDGAWPWLFHAEGAFVVEPYEIYSVHQDAMAPMALLELTDVTGDDQYRQAAVHGLAWSRGANELNFDLIDRSRKFAHRSVRRRAPWHRAALIAGATGALILKRPLVVPPFGLEVNRTCRPYHLGWILEAWAGRETLAQEMTIGADG